MLYKDAKNGIIGEAIVKDGYNGDTAKINLSFVDGHILVVTEHGFYNAIIRTESSVESAKWILKNHPLCKQYYKNLKLY